MANQTKQLTVADLEAAKMNIQAGVVGTGELSIAATCIGIVEEILKCHKKGHVRVCDLRDIWFKAVAAFGVSVNTCAKIHNSVLNDILRAASSEGGAQGEEG